ncbi:MAG: hypothetical protein ABI939_06045 [Anaerolineaceae bacterium]
MKNFSSSQSGIFNVRVAVAVVLCTFAAALGWLSFAANPPSGTITTAGPAVTWNGTSGTGAPTAGGESECAPDGSNCDTFSLTISGTPSDWATANKRVHVQINWLTPSSDYDMFIHRGDLTGPIVVESANGGTTQEQGDLDPTRPNIGTGLFTVHVV